MVYTIDTMEWDMCDRISGKNFKTRNDFGETEKPLSFLTGALSLFTDVSLIEELFGKNFSVFYFVDDNFIHWHLVTIFQFHRHLERYGDIGF